MSFSLFSSSVSKMLHGASALLWVDKNGSNNHIFVMLQFAALRLFSCCRMSKLNISCGVIFIVTTSVASNPGVE